MASTAINFEMNFEKLERPNAPFSFAAAPQGTVEKRLAPSRGELVRVISKELEDRANTLLVCPSAEIFRCERAKVFGEYALLLKAASKIMLTDTDPMVYQAIVQDVLSYYEDQIRTRAEAVFSAEVAGEILFSLATMRRTHRLVGYILAKLKACPLDAQVEDDSHAKEFSSAILWCSLHLDCLLRALEDQERRVPLDVLQELLGGLRYSVTAYAHARAGYDLRYPKQTGEQTQWDDEDRFLARLSTDDSCLAE